MSLIFILEDAANVYCTVAGLPPLVHLAANSDEVSYSFVSPWMFFYEVVFCEVREDLAGFDMHITEKRVCCSLITSQS